MHRDREAKFGPLTRGLALAVLSLTMGALTWSAAIVAFPLTQGGDGQYFHRVMEIAKVSVRRYHELPLWNAFECGGVPLWDNPEMPVASPLVYLTLPLSGTHTMWAWFILHTAAGFAAMWVFARRELHLSRIATFASASLWALGVGHVTQYAGGHATLCNFYLFPLLLLLFRRSEEDVDCAVWLGLVFAYMLSEGSLYPIVHGSLLLVIEAVLRLVLGGPAEMPRRFARMVRGAAVTSAVVLSVSACRLLPVMDQVARHKRELPVETDAISSETLRAMFFDRQHAWGVPGQTYVWPEFASYFGYVTLALVFVGIAVGGLEHAWFLLVGVAAFLLMLGHFADWAPWHFLKEHVFPFKAMRVPSRYRLLLACFIAGYVGLAADRLHRTLRTIGASRPIQESARFVAVAFALFAAGDVYGVSNLTVGQKYVAAAETVVTPSTRFYLEGAGLAPFLDQPRQNRGRLACADSWVFTDGAPVWTGDVPQARAADDGAVVEVANRTPGSFTIDVDVKTPGAKVRVNTPWEAGWRTSIGRALDENKLLVLELPQGRHRVLVKYWPRGMTAGLVLTALGLVGSAAWLARRRVFAARRTPA